MEALPLTPLKKHRGQHGGAIALAVLAGTTVVVWTTHEPPRWLPTTLVRTASGLRLRVTPANPDPAPAIEVRTPVAPEPRVPGLVTATGKLTFDELRTSHVGAPVAGWLRKTRAKSLGRTIRAGETVGVIHSPEVYLASADVIAELRDFKSQEQLDAKRVKLLRWGMRREALARIEATLVPQPTLPLIARVTGIVVDEQGPPAGLVDSSSAAELFTITDPTYAWVYVEVPAGDAARARLGMPARLAIEGMAQPVTAPIGYISRRIEDGTRTVRFDIHSAALRMRRGAEVKAELQLDPAGSDRSSRPTR